MRPAQPVLRRQCGVIYKGNRLSAVDLPACLLSTSSYKTGSGLMPGEVCSPGYRQDRLQALQHHGKEQRVTRRHGQHAVMIRQHGRIASQNTQHGGKPGPPQVPHDTGPLPVQVLIDDHSADRLVAVQFGHGDLPHACIEIKHILDLAVIAPRMRVVCVSAIV